MSRTKIESYKEIVKKYNKSLAVVVLPSYFNLLNDTGDWLDEYYKGCNWYNDKEKNIMLYDILDDALLSLKMSIWDNYNSSKQRKKLCTLSGVCEYRTEDGCGKDGFCNFQMEK